LSSQDFWGVGTVDKEAKGRWVYYHHGQKGNSD